MWLLSWLYFGWHDRPHRDQCSKTNRRKTYGAVTNFAMMDPVDRSVSSEPIVCPLWVSNDRRFRSRRYHAWDRSCSLCGRKVIVSDAINQRIQSGNEIVVVCEDCAVFELPGLVEPDPGSTDKSNAWQSKDPCPTCATLKEQEQAAAKEWAQVANFRDATSEAIYRKWTHLATARARHRAKAHANEPRGRH